MITIQENGTDHLTFGSISIRKQMHRAIELYDGKCIFTPVSFTASVTRLGLCFAACNHPYTSTTNFWFPIFRADEILSCVQLSYLQLDLGRWLSSSTWCINNGINNGHNLLCKYAMHLQKCGCIIWIQSWKTHWCYVSSKIYKQQCVCLQQPSAL